jgi:hypothetical protein
MDEDTTPPVEEADALAVLAERISEHRVCLLGIEDELVEAMQQLAQEETEASEPATIPATEPDSGAGATTRP